MATIVSKNNSSLKIKYDCGIDIHGDAVIRNTTYNNINPNISHEILREFFAETLETFQKQNLKSVVRVDNTELS